MMSPGHTLPISAYCQSKLVHIRKRPLSLTLKTASGPKSRKLVAVLEASEVANLERFDIAFRILTWCSTDMGMSLASR